LQILRGFGDARQGCHIVARGKRQAGINSCAERCDDARGFAGRTVAEKPDRQDRRPLRARGHAAALPSVAKNFRRPMWLAM
jgi:hypothetical protein